MEGSGWGGGGGGEVFFNLFFPNLTASVWPRSLGCWGRCRVPHCPAMNVRMSFGEGKKKQSKILFKLTDMKTSVRTGGGLCAGAAAM